MPADHLRVAIYARVSPERQTQEGTIASQLEALDRRVRDDGLACDSELRFVDDGVSGPYCSGRGSSGSATRPPPAPSTTSTSTTRIGSHANMHTKS